MEADLLDLPPTPPTSPKETAISQHVQQEEEETTPGIASLKYDA